MNYTVDPKLAENLGTDEADRYLDRCEFNPSNILGSLDAVKYASPEQVTKIKQLSKLRLETQTENFKYWAQIDAPLKFKSKMDFTNPAEFPSGFSFVKIRERGNINYNKIAPESDWLPLSKRSVEKYKAFNLTSKVIRYLRKINLRAHSLQVDVDVQLLGDSGLDIALRSNFYQNEETCIVRVSKQESYEQQRLFIMFGFLDPETREFLMAKRTELPIFKPIEQKILLALKIIDNGDDLISVSGVINNNGKNKFEITYEQTLIPIFTDVELMLAGSGAVLLRALDVEVVNRLPNAVFQKKVSTAECSSCCRVF